jgi:hypothetical protein
VGLERGPLSLVSTVVELLERKSISSGLEIREYGRKDPLLRPREALSDKRRSVGIVRLRTKAMELICLVHSVTFFYSGILHPVAFGINIYGI